MIAEPPYHEGELQAQRRAGEEAIARRTGTVISGRMPIRALPFVEQQRMVVLSSLAPDGAVWSSLVFGPPGFATPTGQTGIDIDLSRAHSHPEDPLWSNLEQDPRAGLLLIELASRRRLRVNGTVELTGSRLRLSIAEAYPNCPKYIQRRLAKPLDAAEALPRPPARRGLVLETRHLEGIGAADTFFVASAHPDRHPDASHRGGNPGFVEVVDGRALRIPDYPGNSMFNTFGNFVVYPKAGLAFVDFERGMLLQLTGTVDVDWHVEGGNAASGGTGRFWTVTVDQWLETVLPLSMDWELLDSSPFNP